MNSIPAPATLSTLISSIYDCAVEPARWDQTLAMVATQFSCGKAILSLHDLRQDRALITSTIGWDPRWLEERNRHLPEIHAGLSRWRERQRDEDEPFVASREPASDAAETSPYIRG
jgi:hypothetical protein